MGVCFSSGHFNSTGRTSAVDGRTGGNTRSAYRPGIPDTDRPAVSSSTNWTTRTWVKIILIILVTRSNHSSQTSTKYGTAATWRNCDFHWLLFILSVGTRRRHLFCIYSCWALRWQTDNRCCLLLQWWPAGRWPTSTRSRTLSVNKSTLRLKVGAGFERLVVKEDFCIDQGPRYVAWGSFVLRRIEPVRVNPVNSVISQHFKRTGSEFAIYSGSRNHRQ